MICYHHNDMDGKAAGFCVHKFKPSDIQDTTTSYICRTYNDEFDKHSKNDIVFIVDLSFSESTYQKLLTVCRTARRVIWIDHHKSSIKVIKEHRDELQKIGNLIYFISDCACGAALTYAFLHCPLDKINKLWNRQDGEEYDIKAYYHNLTDKAMIEVSIVRFDKGDPTSATWHEEGIELPRWLFHVDDYDCWKKQDKQTELFTLGLDVSDYSVVIKDRDRYIFNDIWERMSNDNEVELDAILGRGSFISEYIHTRYRSELKNTFEWTHNGITLLCKNGTGNSWCFEHLIEKYDACILFYFEGKYGKWKYSVFSSDRSNFDCEAFAIKFGGGGHLHAAGFSTDKLIFTSNDFATMEKKERTIFLGGTTTDDWRTGFIHKWKKAMNDPSNKKIKDVKLFDPIVPNWNKECQKKENEIKDSAFINLFVITPKAIGVYSFAEAVECSHKPGCKTLLIIYDKYDNGFNAHQRKSIDATGDIIEKNGGIYEYISGENALDDIVDIVIKAASK